MSKKDFFSRQFETWLVFEIFWRWLQFSEKKNLNDSADIYRMERVEILEEVLI